ncbi:PadR family transcriptional regulator [Labrys neptuniae]
MAQFKRSPLALAVLALLIEAPMHPYRMQQLLKSRGKEEVINIRQRASLYQTIERLEREGLIAASGVERGEGRPDRTVYMVTPLGRTVALDWLRAMLAEPHNEFPEFPVAMSFLPLLSPEEAALLLEARLAALLAQEGKLKAELEHYLALLPRVVLLESQYMLAAVSAERAWVEGVVADLRSGALAWSLEELAKVAAEFEREAPPRPG